MFQLVVINELCNNVDEGILNIQDNQCIRTIQGSSCKYCCRERESNVYVYHTISVYAFVALGIRHAMRMRHIVVCGLPPSTIFFSITL
jgi:hypothetical protein